MANEQNLKPFTSDQSRDEAVKNGRKGGIRSGEVRRENKLIKDRILERMGETDWDLMIDKLIDAKIAAGQLDNCPLSYGDIARVRKILKEKMMSIYHVRVEYPKVEK